MTKVVGITGGIGSGKSTLSEYLMKIGYAVHESDKTVSQIYNKPKKSFIKFLNENISKDVFKNNKINKKIIAEIIFRNSHIKKKLEKYLHKEVKKSRHAFIKKNQKNKKGLIFVDVPLLFENKLEKEFDVVLCVIAKKNIRRKRVIKTKKFSKPILEKIFKSQISDIERKNRSKIVIYNNKTKNDFIFSADKALIYLLK